MKIYKFKILKNTKDKAIKDLQIKMGQKVSRIDTVLNNDKLLELVFIEK